MPAIIPLCFVADDVLIDLLTDSGTSAMSFQTMGRALWTAMNPMPALKASYRFEEAVKKITGLKYIIPTHQGRAAEKILFTIQGWEREIYS